MHALPPPQAPPAVVILDRDSGVENLLAERIASTSDPELGDVLRRTWAGSKSFRETLTALFREQPKVHLELVKADSESFGDLILTKDPAFYPLKVLVQWRAVRRGKDLPEPWLASILFALLEVSRRDAVLPQGEQEYQFTDSTKQRMWNFQTRVRRELRAFNPKHYRSMASNGEFIYRTVLAERPRSFWL